MPTDTAAALLAELTRHGIELKAWGNRLRYRPRSAMTPDLAARVKAHKPELLKLLAAGDSVATPQACSERTARRITDAMLCFGEVCPGWKPACWAKELRKKAGRCDRYRPDIAEYYRNWAADIERRLGTHA